jgi:hypothetical protein
MAVANTLRAFYDMTTIKAVKSFVMQVLVECSFHLSLSPDDRGRIRTIDLRIMSRVLHHCAARGTTISGISRDVNAKTGKSYRTGKLSTVHLLVLTSLDQLFFV